MSVLEVKDLSIHFGGIKALQHVDLRAGEWEIVGIIGPNGAGKTTLFNCITGFYTPTEGSVHYRGRNISKLPVHKRTGLGIGRTFQRSEEHTFELQSRQYLVCRLLLEKKKKNMNNIIITHITMLK